MINLEQAMELAKEFLEKGGVLLPLFEGGNAEPNKWVVKFRAVIPPVMYFIEVNKETGEIEAVKTNKWPA